MWRRDYFVRMVEQLGQVLAQVLKLTDGKEYGEAGTMLNQASRELIGLEIDPLMQLSDEDTINLLQRHTATVAWTEKGVVLATLLHMDAELQAAQDDENAAYFRHLKVLHLLLAVAEDEVGEPADFAPTIEEMLEKLSDYVLPDTTYQKVMAYFEQQGAFAKVEDVLYEWLEGESTNLTALESGLTFYQRLLQLPEESLVAGNLPQVEVDATLADLQTRYQAALAM